MADEFVKIGADGPALNTSALRDAGRAFLNSGAKPDVGTPNASASVEETPSPVTVQSSVTVSTPGEQASTPQNEMPGVSATAPGLLTQKVDAQGQQVVTNAQGEVVDLPDDALVKVKVNGVEQVKKWGDARREAMLHSHYTREMQQLRQREEEFGQREGTLTAEAEMGRKLATIVTNPQMFRNFIATQPELASEVAKMFGTTTQAALSGTTGLQAPVAQPALQPAPFSAPFQAPGNPEELTNFQDVTNLLGQTAQTLEQRLAAALEARAQGFMGQVDSVVAQKLAELEDVREISALTVSIDQTINENLNANPALKAFPGIAKTLREEASKLRPRTPAEMTEALNIVARGIVEGLDQNYRQTQTTQLIQKQNLASKGIEPPVGGVVNTTVKPNLPSMVKPGGGLDIEAMKRAGKAFLS
jgi:hypothetical protein